MASDGPNARQASLLGDRIRKARLEAGLTQKELAERIGTGSRRVAAWEAGDNAPTPGYAVLLADELEQDRDAFIVDRPAAQRDVAARLALVEARLERLEQLLLERLDGDSPPHP